MKHRLTKNHKLTRKMIKEPLVTVYIPTYNRLELLKRAVQSVFNQDYKNIEVIVVDDGSSDGTIQYLEKLSKQRKNFLFFVNEVNLGACVSRNKAIRAATGEFITGLDDDDYFKSNRVSEFIKKWGTKKQNTIALYSNSFLIMGDRRIKKTRRPKTTKRDDLIYSNYIGNQVFTKTETLKKIKGFDEEFEAWQDIECWYRLLKAFNSQAELAKKTTYYIDKSHPHERISNNASRKVDSACGRFISKNKIQKKDQRILNIQKTLYSKENCAISDTYFRLKSKPNLRNTAFFFKNLARTLRDL